jgi:molybdopterin molybdotransferase
VARKAIIARTIRLMTDALLSVAEARARILAGIQLVDAESIALRDAAGRVLAEPLVAQRDSPPRSMSAMDGYAVEARAIAKAPVELAISQVIPAGASALPLAPGTAARIFTGALVPDGADCVVAQEGTQALPASRVLIKEASRAGTHVRAGGSDFAVGVTGLGEGRTLNARDIGLAAAMNAATVEVRRRPRVAVLATGDELVALGGSPSPHQIIASSGPALCAALSLWGAEVYDLGIVRDDEAAIAAAAESARGGDLLLTLGGASVGDHDLVQRALTRLGFELGFWRVAMKPGKPLIHGRLGELPVLGLPGNPVSTLVCALLFVRPAIRTMLGCRKTDGTPDLELPRREAQLAHPLAANGPREDFLRGRLTDSTAGPPLAEAFDRQDSSGLLAFAGATCLIPRTPFAHPSKAGEPHPIIPLAGLF